MTKRALQKRLSANLKLLRKGKFTQEELADASGVSAQMLGHIEGCRRWPSETTIVRLANALDVDAQALFAPSPDESPQSRALFKAVAKKVTAQVRAAVEDALRGLELK